MTDKEKADCLIELHKEESIKHKQLVDLEFKINISLWSLIIVAGYFILKDILPSFHGNYILILAIGYLLISVLIALAHFHFWVFPITRSQAVSNYFIKSYLCKIKELSGFSISSNPAKSKPDIKKFNDLAANYKNWILVEIGITILLLVLIFLLGIFGNLK